MSVPHTLKRPGCSCVDPRKTAANAGSSSAPPNVSDGPDRDAYRTPATPHSVALVVREIHVQIPVRTPDSRAASAFPPTA